MTAPEHEPGCLLDPVHWLRHAIAATNRRISGEAISPDRLASESLLNALEHFAERPDWRTVTLLEVAQYASLMGEKFSQSCTCGRGGGDDLRTSRAW